MSTLTLDMQQKSHIALMQKHLHDYTPLSGKEQIFFGQRYLDAN